MTIETISYHGTIPETSADLLLFLRNPISDQSMETIRTAFLENYADAIVLSAADEGESICYDPVTLDILFASFDGFALSQKLFLEFGGFDKSLGDSAAADLALRLKASGKTVRFLPLTESLSLLAPMPEDRTARFSENLLMRAKHGSKAQFREGIRQTLKAIKHPDIYRVNRKQLFTFLILRFLKLLFLRLKQTPTRGLLEVSGTAYGFLRGTAPALPLKDTPLVSIVVRTYRRPGALQKTLESLRNQRYPNFEVIVVEDSEPASENIVLALSKDLKIRYHAMGKNAGRAKAAAKGIELAKGTYINLLDDDDYLFPEYLQTAVSIAEKESSDIVFSASVALEADVLSESPYRIAVRRKRLMSFPQIDVFSMLRQCLVASNAVLFKKSCYQRAGGIRDDLDAHEDWSLWLRMMASGRFTSTPYAAACFTVPADPSKEEARLTAYRAFDDLLLSDERLIYSLSGKELRKNYNDLIHGLMFLKQHGQLDAHIESEYQKITEKTP